MIDVRLSNPFTYRQADLANVTSLLAAVGVVALGLAVDRRRRARAPLHDAAAPPDRGVAALAEGDFAQRDRRGPTSAPARRSSTELAVQFNAMAERLEESVEIIRRDRDRSRDFLADVSHELRTPIAALLHLQRAAHGAGRRRPDARAEFLETSRVQLERLDWLAQNLLELSKLDSGLVLLDLRPDDLRAAVESAVEQAEPAAAAPRASSST